MAPPPPSPFRIAALSCGGITRETTEREGARDSGEKLVQVRFAWALTGKHLSPFLPRYYGLFRPDANGSARVQLSVL